jgi:hypothetical protein
MLNLNLLEYFKHAPTMLQQVDGVRILSLPPRYINTSILDKFDIDGYFFDILKEMDLDIYFFEFLYKIIFI